MIFFPSLSFFFFAVYLTVITAFSASDSSAVELRLLIVFGLRSRPAAKSEKGFEFVEAKPFT